MKKLITACLLTCLVVAVCTMKTSAQSRGVKLNHMAFYVVDLKKSTAFYRDILRVDTIPEPFHDGKHTWFTVGPHSQFHLIQGAKQAVAHDKNTHLCFSVPSIEEVIATLEKNKIDYTNWAGTGKTPTVRVDGVRQIYLKDPDGYWIEINNDKL
ncbi:MAG TPA: VOC family protein [Chitinophagaceae bacterium]|jgi:lactoylglutathione lyase|nr:VOC family protein [Chitinophagaceae bacterium]